MKSLVCLTVILYILGLNVQSGSTLTCYQCWAPTGRNDPCEVNVNNRTVAAVPCFNIYNSCMTHVYNQTIERTCASTNTCAQLHNQTGFRSCYTCTHNLCNSGFSPSYLTSLVVSFLLFSAIKCFQ